MSAILLDGHFTERPDIPSRAVDSIPQRGLEAAPPVYLGQFREEEMSQQPKVWRTEWDSA